MRYNFTIWTMAVLICSGLACSSFVLPARGQGIRVLGEGPQNAAKHPPLFFSEGWKQTEAEEHPFTQDAVTNPNLELKLYGNAKEMLLTGANGGGVDNPVRIFMGLCGPCAATLRDRNNYVDLTGLAKIRWVTRVSGFHKLRPVVKLADETFWVGNHADGEISDYHETEFSFSDLRWIKLDIDKVVTRGNFMDKIDLSKVDEVGWVDLLPGSGHGQGGFSVLSRFEVYGTPVPREAAQSQSHSGN